MKGEMKNRLALLSILLVAGLLMAGMGTVLGAGNLLRFAGKQVSAVAMNDQLKIYEDGKLVLEGFKEVYSEVVTEASRIANELMLERRFSYALAQRPWSSIGFS
ncbi:MAG: hypothetical protein DRQ03_08525 [Candidatus Hydrothermota bacterium]|nr:MAG: hypothetical protein DRQ03_08525 [Candidatus Hydrothermae bacterium]